jgi:hypothetical protein
MAHMEEKDCADVFLAMIKDSTNDKGYHDFADAMTTQEVMEASAENIAKIGLTHTKKASDVEGC